MEANREIRPVLWFILFMFLVPVVFLVWASAYTEGEEGTQAEAMDIHAPADVSFAADVLPVLETSCGQCHGAEPDPEFETDLQLMDYAALMIDADHPLVMGGEPAHSSLYTVLVDGEEPHADLLTAEEMALLEQWIVQGASDN